MGLKKENGKVVRAELMPWRSRSENSLLSDNDLNIPLEHSLLGSVVFCAAKVGGGGGDVSLTELCGRWPKALFRTVGEPKSQ